MEDQKVWVKVNAGEPLNRDDVVRCAADLKVKLASDYPVTGVVRAQRLWLGWCSGSTIVGTQKPGRYRNFHPERHLD